MKEIKNDFLLDDQEYEHLLIITRERYAKSTQFYEEGIAIKDSQPLQAVKLLYKAYELNYSSPAKDELFAFNRPLSTSPEIFNEEGTPEDLFYRGLQALSGIGRNRNNDIALQYLHTAAGKGYAPAKTRIGILYRYEKGGLPEDHTKAVEWWKSAAENGEIIAQACLGIFYAEQQNFSEAWKWHQLAAKQGDGGAQYCLGYMCIWGEGCTKNHKEALKWSRLAAEHNIAEAQLNIGCIFLDGVGIPHDFPEALKWLRLSALQGNGIAQFNIGLMFFKGIEVKQDYTEALKWFQMAAANEYPLAQYMLGVMYFNHLQDQKESMKWFRRAAKQGVRYPQGKYSGILSLLFSNKPTIDDFQAHYDFAMMNHDSPTLQKLCAKNVNLFCEILQNDTLLTTDERYEWINYLFEHHFLQLSLGMQLSVAESIYFHDAIPKETAIRLIKTLKHFPEGKERYIDALRLLWNLSQVVDAKGYLAEYFLSKYLEKKPEDKYLYEKNSRIVWDGLSLEYCNAEIKLTSEKFKLWIETQVRDLESIKNTLSSSELNLLHEFYYRLAHFEYEKALALKQSQDASFFSKVSSLWWTKPAPIQITPVIHFLKNISLEHTRFEEAQLLLRECREHFKESFQMASENASFILKLKQGKQH